MATFIALRHPVTILVTVSTNPDNFTNDLSIFKDDSDTLLLCKALKQSDKNKVRHRNQTSVPYFQI